MSGGGGTRWCKVVLALTPPEKPAQLPKPDRPAPVREVEHDMHARFPKPGPLVWIREVEQVDLRADCRRGGWWRGRPSPLRPPPPCCCWGGHARGARPRRERAACRRDSRRAITTPGGQSRRPAGNHDARRAITTPGGQSRRPAGNHDARRCYRATTAPTRPCISPQSRRAAGTTRRSASPACLCCAGGPGRRAFASYARLLEVNPRHPRHPGSLTRPWLGQTRDTQHRSPHPLAASEPHRHAQIRPAPAAAPLSSCPEVGPAPAPRPPKPGARPAAAVKPTTGALPSDRPSPSTPTKQH